MNRIIPPFILFAALALPLKATAPLPATSSIEIKVTRTVKIAEKPTKEEEAAEKAKGQGHVCFADQAHYSFEPIFRRGEDAKSSELLLNIYIITTDTERKMEILKPTSQIISADPKSPLVPDTSYHHRLQWRCKCKTEGRPMKREPEWYAEVGKDGKILCSARSSSNSTINKLIDTRENILISQETGKHFIGAWHCNGMVNDIYRIKPNMMAQHANDNGTWIADREALTITWNNGYRTVFDINQSGDVVLAKSFRPGATDHDILKFTRVVMVDNR